MDALVEKLVETKPEEPKKEDTKKDGVKTGDSTAILPLVTLIGLACVAFIFLKKKRA